MSHKKTLSKSVLTSEASKKKKKKGSIELMMTYLIWRIRCVQSVTYTGGTCWSSHARSRRDRHDLHLYNPSHMSEVSGGLMEDVTGTCLSPSDEVNRSCVCPLLTERSEASTSRHANSSEFYHVTWAWIHIWEEIDPSSLPDSTHTAAIWMYSLRACDAFADFL